MKKFKKIIEYLFYLFIFLLPWQTRWIWHWGNLGDGTSQYLSFSLYATEILLLIILLLTLVYRLKKKDEDANLLNLKVLDFYILIFLFFIVAILSLFFAGDKQVAFYYLIKMLEGLAILIFIINFKFSLRKFAWAFILSGFVQAILAIGQFITQKVYASKWLGMAVQLPETLGVSVIETGGQRWLRAYGAFTHPNILGAFLAVCLIVLVVLLVLNHHQKQQIFFWLSLPIIVIGLFLSFSKAAFLALLIGLIFLGIFILLHKAKQPKKTFGQIILIMAIVLTTLFVFYPQLVLTRVSGTERLEQKSLTERSNYYVQAKDLLQDNWLKGTGLGNYTLALYNQDLEKKEVWAYQPVHNVYFLLGVELGVLGFILFILIIIQTFREIWHFKIDEHLRLLPALAKFKIATISNFYQRKFYWFLGLTAIWLMLLVLMLFDHYFWTQYFGIIFWWLMFALWLKQVSLLK
jgi:O-antigen ligase